MSRLGELIKGEKAELAEKVEVITSEHPEHREQDVCVWFASEKARESPNVVLKCKYCGGTNVLCENYMPTNRQETRRITTG